MTDVLQIASLVVVYFMILCALPLFLLHVVRSLAEQRTRLRELQASVDLLEARAGRSDRVT